MSDKYDAIAEKIFQHLYMCHSSLMKMGIAEILRESFPEPEAKPAAVPSLLRQAADKLANALADKDWGEAASASNDLDEYLYARPAPVPSAEDWANELARAISGQGSVWIHDIMPFIESRDADQRQAGREEALDIYNDALVVMDIRHAELITCYARLEEAAKCVQREKAECSEVSIQAWDAIDEALDELGKARRG